MLGINHYQSFFVVIPAEAGHDVKHLSAIQVNSRSWFFWMQDQVRHDGELWTVELEYAKFKDGVFR